jgi:hypothetical protein
MSEEFFLDFSGPGEFSLEMAVGPQGPKGDTAGLEVAESPVESGLNTRVLFNNNGKLGEYPISGTGDVAMTDDPDISITATGTTTARTLADRSADIVNVKDWGAVGNSNGSIENGADDTAAIQAAVDYAKSRGAAVYFPSACYRVTDSIDCSTNNGFYHLFGDGYGSKIYLDSAVNTAAFNFSPASSGSASLLPLVRVSGLNFIPPRTATSSSNRALAITNNQRAVVENCYAQQYYLGVTAIDSYGIRLLRNNFSGVKASAIYSPPSDASFNVGEIIGNSIYGCGLVTGDAAVNVGRANGGLVVARNNVESCAGAFLFSGSTECVAFSHNYMENQTVYDVYWSAASVSWNIENNRIGSGRTTTWENLVDCKISYNAFAGGAGTITIANTNTGLWVGENTVEVGVSLINNSIGGSSQIEYGGDLRVITAGANVASVVTVGGVQTLTNKTLTAPVINSPSGLAKGDVGLGNVDNTSDSTKNAAAATLTNKTLTSPLISDVYGGAADTAVLTLYGTSHGTPAGSSRVVIKGGTVDTITVDRFQQTTIAGIVVMKNAKAFWYEDNVGIARDSFGQTASNINYMRTPYANGEAAIFDASYNKMLSAVDGGQIALAHLTRLSVDAPVKLKTYTVAGLPSSGQQIGDLAFATDLRVFNGAGTQEGSGAGTGGVVSWNGSAWKIVGTNVTAVS